MGFPTPYSVLLARKQVKSDDWGEGFVESFAPAVTVACAGWFTAESDSSGLDSAVDAAKQTVFLLSVVEAAVGDQITCTDGVFDVIKIDNYESSPFWKPGLMAVTGVVYE